MKTTIHGTCEETGKAIYYNRKAARRSLHGSLRKRTVRVYPCLYHPSHSHLTREWKHELKR